MRRALLGILSMKRNFGLIGCLEFLGMLVVLVVLVVSAFRRSVVSRLWRKGPKPLASSLSLATGVVYDISRSKQQLVLENALLRQQLIVLRRQINRLQLNNADRALLVLLASRLRSWKEALLIVQPDTLLRWHRKGFRLPPILEGKV